jgi:hypothetical protein
MSTESNYNNAYHMLIINYLLIHYFTISTKHLYLQSVLLLYFLRIQYDSYVYYRCNLNATFTFKKLPYHVFHFSIIYKLKQ